ncbi:hypothetical protein BDN72DRAFT_309176 [Pluteus cervinus]|uniref:Uncharacterized protein n=1 Tax=Pluteus cervinus TaxID=181527 RepID=A0ACD3ADL1_9AGAR|nr:hypothetical protein BDN72DRAFT_309176 [Pluteus cervinus]
MGAFVLFGDCASQQMSSPPSDSLPGVLQEIFSFSLPRPSYRPGKHKERRLVGTTPFTFYDQHINPSQSIKHVVLLPSIVGDILRVVDDRLAELRHLGQGPLPLTDATRTDFENDLHHRVGHFSPSPESVAAQCMNSITWTCLNLVSSWAIHPRATKYYRALWLDDDKIQLPLQSLDDPKEDVSIRFIPPHLVDPDVLSSIDDSVKGALRDWCNRDLSTSLYLPMAPHTEALLRNLDELAALPVLPTAGPATQGCHRHSKITPTTCDAEKPLWTLPSFKDHGEASPAGYLDVEGHAITPSPLLAPCLSEFGTMKNVTAEGIAHHMWNLALGQDTTIIVINTGLHERIGIRHRATRTLYLSDIIETTKSGYGKLHLGLQMAAVLDALDRYRQHRKLQPVPVSKKRPRREEPKPESELRRSTRHKMNLLSKINKDLSGGMSLADNLVLWNELDQRPIALLRFCDGHLQSPVPSCCIRSGGALSPFAPESAQDSAIEWKGSYQPRECFTLLLSSPYSQIGGTGRVFKAQLEITLATGRKLLRDVVAKVAVHEEARKRMRHEYKVYQHLWQHNVKRIPEIYGLFQDYNNLADILVLERARFSFRQREPWTDKNGTVLKQLAPSDKSACISIVKAMHKAGVVHYDLRAENLVIAQDGKPMVIDFDRARLNPSDNDKKKEMDNVERFMNGKTLEDFLVISFAGP